MWIPVSSSNIAALAYSNDQLLLKFTNGSVYAYLKVPEKTFELMKVSESVGKFFHAEIKPYFNQIKLEEDPFLAETRSI